MVFQRLFQKLEEERVLLDERTGAEYERLLLRLLSLE